MSLLLQALQKAARNRQVGGPEPGIGDGPQLELEPRETAEFSASGAQFDVDPGGPALVGRRAVSPAAASVLSEAVPAGPSLMDHIRDRPVAVFGLFALLFAVCYGVYIYIQLSHPTLLSGQISAPVVSTNPAPPTQSFPPVAPASPSPGAQSLGAAPLPPSANSALPSAQGVQPAQNSELAALMNLPPKSDTPNQLSEIPGNVGRLGSALSELDKLTKELAPPKPAPKSEAPPPAPQPAVAPKPPPAPPAQASAPLKGALSGPKRLSRAAEQPVVELQDQVIVNAAPGMAPPAGPTVADGYRVWKSGKLEQAKTIYLDVLANDSKNTDALLGLAGIAQQQGNSQEALEYFGRVLEAEPRNSAAQAGIIAMTGQSDPAASETRLKLLISREPTSFLHFSLGNLYARQGQWIQAQQSYFQAYQMDADNSDYAYNLAVSLDHIGQGKLAVTYYRKALDLSLKQGRATFNQEQVIDRIAKLSLRSN